MDWRTNFKTPVPSLALGSMYHRVAAAWKSLQERNVVLEDTEEDYAAKLGDSVSQPVMLMTAAAHVSFWREKSKKTRKKCLLSDVSAGASSWILSVAGSMRWIHF